MGREGMMQVWGGVTTVDPLAEKYYSTGVYAYCLNNPIYFIDKDGLEPGHGDLFKTQKEAAKDWGMYYNGASIIRKRKMGSSIYEVKQSLQQSTRMEIMMVLDI